MKDTLLIAAVVLLSLTVSALLLYLFTLRRSLREIREQMEEKLTTDTNTLISISSGDPQVRALTAELNRQLRALRQERLRLRHGDLELKEAVTNISHDLRTPLTAICGYLDLLEQEDKSEAVERCLEIIRNRTEILAQLTEELFRYSVIISSERDTVKEPVVINGILEESIAAFYATFNERGIVPNIQISEEKVIRTLDPSALTRVFSNILNNAVKYSDGDLDIVLTDAGEILFTNTAVGLNEVQLGKLFDRFYTVEAARKSTGLGLAIARTLIEQMNGTISAKYESSRLSICIVLPDAEETLSA